MDLVLVISEAFSHISTLANFTDQEKSPGPWYTWGQQVTPWAQQKPQKPHKQLTPDEEEHMRGTSPEGPSVIVCVMVSVMGQV